MSTLDQMGTLGTLSIGAAISTCGHWGEMGTRKNEHQGKLTFEANGHWDGTLGRWTLEGNGHQEK